VLFITPSARTVIDDVIRSLGQTLPTESLNRRIYPSETTMTVSPSPDTHYVYYTTALGSPADSSMAHELFGHLWLAIKGVPWVHPSQPAAIVARGTLTAQHGIRDPFGNIYTGTVQDFINRYVGSETGMLASPTQNVGPQLLQRALTAFKTGFASGATGTLNGSWHVSQDANSQWEMISSNYALVPQPAAAQPTPTPAPVPSRTQTPAPVPSGTQAPAPVPSRTQTPASVPSGTQAPAPVPSRTQTPAPVPSGTQAPAPAPATTASTTQAVMTQANIEQDLTAWYGTLNPDKQYVFIECLESIQTSFQRRTQLTSRLLSRLSRPQGMASPPSRFP
jgi:hypothetical protein